MWLHSEAAPVVDSATQRLLEENNQLLNQISANIETFKVCIYLYLSCLWSALALFVLSSVSHKVHGACKLFVFNYGCYLLVIQLSCLLKLHHYFVHDSTRNGYYPLTAIVVISLIRDETEWKNL